MILLTIYSVLITHYLHVALVDVNTDISFVKLYLNEQSIHLMFQSFFFFCMGSVYKHPVLIRMI